MTNPLRRLSKRLPRLRRAVRRIKHAGVYWPTRFMLWGVNRLSPDAALNLAERAGALLFRVLRKPRRLAVEHLRIAFGDQLSEASRVRLAGASFINIARCFCEIAQIDTLRPQFGDYIEIDGWDHAQAVLDQGRGAVVITGHVGNWELMAAYFAWKGLPMATIARRAYEPRLNQLIVDLRRQQGVQTILLESPNATRDLLRVLKNHGLLAIVIDQEPKAASESVPFFSRAAHTPAAAASLAVRRKLPVFAAFIQRRPQRGHRITILPPFAVPDSGDVPTDIRDLTAIISEALEEQIRKNPAEWVWWHRRWWPAPLTDLDLDRELPYAYSPSGL
ncbi:MAG: lysophospholipid acyltransferase family protein [Deltaproteobacteria bacterium]|nr:lysophospholipid acyltransferase family protein [Deltaproteobacteria bacterium]MBI3388081.1 lysophospholipid acyltransferase family protein [Deltaproteobacteria bacterium]